MKKRAALQTAAPLALFVLSAGLMVRDALLDPYDPSLEGTRRYGHNGPGQLGPALLVTAIELAVALAVLRPWSLSPGAWPRPLALALLLGLWALPSLFFTLHAGGLFALHALWVLALLALSVAALIGLVAERLVGRAAA